MKTEAMVLCTNKTTNNISGSGVSDKTNHHHWLPQEIHSGHFMMSNLDESDDNDSTHEDHKDGILPDPEDESITSSSGSVPIKSCSSSAGTGHKISAHEIDENLSKFFECLTVVYPGKITNPKWNQFRGVKFTLKDKIRLNNIIWREYHMQFVKKKKAQVVQFASPLAENHVAPEAVVIDGKYWNRRQESVCNEYKQWRTFPRPRATSALLEPITGHPAMSISPAVSQLDEILMDFDNLDLFLDQPSICFPDPRDMAQLGNADIMQPGLLQLQPNFDEDFINLDGMDDLFKMPPTSTASLNHLFFPDEVFQPSTSTAAAQTTSRRKSLSGDAPHLSTLLQASGPCSPWFQEKRSSGHYSRADPYSSSALSHQLAKTTASTQSPQNIMTTTGTYEECNVGKAPLQKKPSVDFLKPKDPPIRRTQYQQKYSRRSSQPNITIPRYPQSSLYTIPSNPTTQQHVDVNTTSQGPLYSPPVHHNTLQESQKISRSSGHLNYPALDHWEAPTPYPTLTQAPDQRRYSTDMASLNTSGQQQLERQELLAMINRVMTGGSPKKSSSSPVHQSSTPSDMNFSSANSMRSQRQLKQSPRQSMTAMPNFNTLSSPTPVNNFSTVSKTLQHSHLPLPFGMSGNSSANQRATSHTPIGSNTFSTTTLLDSEAKRKFSIQNGMEMLQTLLPSSTLSPNSTRGSQPKAALLHRAADHIRRLRADKVAMQDEEAMLRRQIDILQTSISCCCSQLPATGVGVSGQRISQGREWFEAYVRLSTLSNWKFYIFSLLMSDLFDSFNSSVSTASFDQVSRTLYLWLEQHCSLVKLRPVVLRAMRSLSTNTSILTDPCRLPEQARAAVTLPSSQSLHPLMEMPDNSSIITELGATGFTSPGSLPPTPLQSPTSATTPGNMSPLDSHGAAGFGVGVQSF